MFYHLLLKNWYNNRSSLLPHKYKTQIYINVNIFHLNTSWIMNTDENAYEQQFVNKIASQWISSIHLEI